MTASAAKSDGVKLDGVKLDGVTSDGVTSARYRRSARAGSPAALARALLAGSLAAIWAAIWAMPAPARADDLRDALEQAYGNNPTLLAARADLRGTDEEVAIQRAAGRPDASVGAQYVEYVKNSRNSFTSPARALGASVSLAVPIYQGGLVRNAVHAAETRVQAGQADLRGTEASVFSDVVATYMDVVQNEAIVGLNRNNVEVLDVNLQATSDRFEIGELTRTDVAQSQSRLALARGDTRAAEANLAAARENYIRLVGAAPNDLQQPPPLPGLPASAEEAVAAATADNPDILAAQQRSRAAGFDVGVVGAERLPRLAVVGSGGYNNYFGTLGGSVSGTYFQTEETAQVGVQATIPLYQGGRPAARIRQARERESATLEQEIATERSVIAQVRSAYTSWQAAQEIVASTQTAVDAASLSLEGVRAENSVGNRTILDILNAEQELLSAQVRLVTARRNAYVAGFSLLAAMGHAEAADLGIAQNSRYDPQPHYQATRAKWSDWSSGIDPATHSTRTLDTPVQDGNISQAKAQETEVKPDATAR